jgi:hypothetical protein
MNVHTKVQNMSCVLIFSEGFVPFVIVIELYGSIKYDDATMREQINTKIHKKNER